MFNFHKYSFRKSSRFSLSVKFKIKYREDSLNLKMSKFSPTYVLEMRDILVKYFTTGFAQLLKSHYEDNHMWFYGKSVFKAVKELNMNKSEVIFFLMGSNTSNIGLGSMSDFSIEPACDIIINKYKKIANEMYPDYKTDIEFTEKPVNDGNFKIFLQMKKIKDDNPNEDKPKGDKHHSSNDAKITYAKVAKAQIKEKIERPSSPAIDRLFSSIASSVKPEPVKKTEIVNITTDNDVEVSDLKKELERLKFENGILQSSVNELKVENKVLKSLIENFLTKSPEPSCIKKKELSESSPQNTTPSTAPDVVQPLPCNGGAGAPNNSVEDEELDGCGNWDDFMHPPSPKKVITPKKE
jgi:hypothetical protein